MNIFITKRAILSQYSDAEEIAHVISHGAGVLLSITGLFWMLLLSSGASDPWRIIASSVYGVSLISLFLASTLYHALPASERKQQLKVLDHCAIYLLIAGTYTPFVLIAMRTEIGWWLFGTIWSLATAGIFIKVRFRHRFPRFSMITYLLMGWLVVIAGPQVAEAIGANGMFWVVAGGVSYTVGTVFYMAKRVPFSHAIWHVFVLAGAICHFLAIVWYVLPVLPAPPING